MRKARPGDGRRAAVAHCDGRGPHVAAACSSLRVSLLERVCVHALGHVRVSVLACVTVTSAPRRLAGGKQAAADSPWMRSLERRWWSEHRAQHSARCARRAAFLDCRGSLFDPAVWSGRATPPLLQRPSLRLAMVPWHRTAYRLRSRPRRRRSAVAAAAAAAEWWSEPSACTVTAATPRVSR